MTVYSVDGAYPGALPKRHRLSSGMTRTSLHEMTTQELAALDPPIHAVDDPPSFNARTHRLAWDGGQLPGGNPWSTVALTSQEVAALQSARRDAIKEAATTKFRQVRSGGTTLTVGQASFTISTTHEAAVELAEASEVLADGNDSFQVVTRAGPRFTVNPTTAAGALSAIRAHVRAAQEREAALHAAADAALSENDPDAALDLINTETGAINGSGSWPAN